MTLRTDIPGADNYVLQSAIGAYADEAYTNARKLSGTGVVGSNPQIQTDTETFIGQMRWFKPLNPKINVLSLTDASEGEKTEYGSDYMRYIKTARSHGAEKVNMKEIVTRHDGLAKVGRDFAETRAQDEHDAILSVLKGVAISEALLGARGMGGQTFNNDPTSLEYGFYVDLGAQGVVTAATTANQGAQRAEGFLHAFGKAYKDYEPDYAYMVVSPEVFASLRSANLVDQDRVTEGSVTFNTIFQGKFRLLQTRANQGLSSADIAKLNTGSGVDIVGTKTSFIILPGSVAMAQLNVPDSTEITRDGNAYKGGGVTSIWHRWGYVLAPAGYDWVGSEDAFPSNADYMSVLEGGTKKALSAVTAADNTVGTWKRKFSSALQLGILPVFHS